MIHKDLAALAIGSSSTTRDPVRPIGVTEPFFIDRQWKLSSRLGLVLIPMEFSCGCCRDSLVGH